jgi:hypothetical protein
MEYLMKLFREGYRSQYNKLAPMFASYPTAKPKIKHNTDTLYGLSGTETYKGMFEDMYKMMYPEQEEQQEEGEEEEEEDEDEEEEEKPRKKKPKKG